MELFVLTSGDYDEAITFGIFDNEELVNNVLKAYPENSIKVNKIPVNTISDHNGQFGEYLADPVTLQVIINGKKLYTVVINLDCEVEEVTQNHPTDYVYDCYVEEYWYKNEDDEYYKVFIHSIWSLNEESAVQEAKEKYKLIKEQGIFDK